MSLESLLKNQADLAYAGQMATPVGGVYRPPTTRQQLEEKRALLVVALSKVEKAIAALDAHPDLEEFVNTIQAAQ